MFSKDFVAHCKKCLGRLLTGPAESELANVRIRTKEGTEVICVTQTDYILVVIQNCRSEHKYVGTLTSK